MSWLIPIGIIIVGIIIQCLTPESTIIYSDGSSEDATSGFGGMLIVVGIIWILVKIFW